MHVDVDEFEQDIKNVVTKFLHKPCQDLIDFLTQSEIAEQYKIAGSGATPDKVVVRFLDGSTIVYDLLIDNKENTENTEESENSND